MTDPSVAAMTMAEKIFARTSGQATVAPGDYVTAAVDRMMANDAIMLIERFFKKASISKIADPDKLVVVFDHFFPAQTADQADKIAVSVDMLEALGVTHYLGAPGVSHQVMSERGFVRPGQLIMGTDSHSTLYGAFGAAGAGIGGLDMAYLLANGSTWFQVPDTVRFNLRGRMGEAVDSKDIVLHLIGRFGSDYCQYKAIEYAGEVAAAMTMSQRMTVANMGVEFGAKFALFAADQVTIDYLSEVTEDPIAPFGPDPGANYVAEHEVDISGLAPQIACPHSPDNVKAVSDVAGLKIDQAYLGSCTNCRVEDLAVAAQVLKGKKVAKHTRLLVAPASQQVLLDATKAGYVETLVESGAHILAATCGACMGLHSGLLGPSEVCISSTNRNFPGRMGSAEAQLYLASPASVAASAIRGEITDPRDIEH